MFLTFRCPSSEFRTKNQYFNLGPIRLLSCLLPRISSSVPCRSDVYGIDMTVIFTVLSRLHKANSYHQSRRWEVEELMARPILASTRSAYSHTFFKSNHRRMIWFISRRWCMLVNIMLDHKYWRPTMGHIVGTGNVDELWCVYCSRDRSSAFLLLSQ